MGPDPEPRAEAPQLERWHWQEDAEHLPNSGGDTTPHVRRSHLQRRAWGHFQRHHAQSPAIFDQLLLSIFQLVAFRNCTRQWSMSRPLLPLILSNTDYFAQYQKQVISQAPPTRQQVLQEAFGKLNEGLDSSLSTKNRDRFTKNLYGAVKMIKE